MKILHRPTNLLAYRKLTGMAAAAFLALNATPNRAPLRSETGLRMGDGCSTCGGERRRAA